MYKGIYLALSGALTKYAQLEVISQNIANADTAGYKKEAVSFSDYLAGVVNDRQSGERTMTTMSAAKTNFSAGALVKTENPYNVALEGEGFIALEGNVFTRRGDMARTAEGFLVARNGLKVLGTTGPIKLPEGAPKIAPNGDVAVNDALVDRIQVRSFAATDMLAKRGPGMYYAAQGSAASNAQLKQGYIESSNVEVVREMVQMIESFREFESFQKAIQMFDEATGKLNNELGRI